MTLARRVIPCLDVAAGRVVKGVSFVNLVDAGDPAELAGIYDAEGADELVFLDITATVEARATLFEAVARTAEQVFIPLTVGGGVRTVEDVQRLLRAGADKVSVNSAAVRDPELLSAGAGTYGVQCMVLAIDARRRRDGTGWEVVVDGGRTPTGLDALAWAEEGGRARRRRAAGHQHGRRRPEDRLRPRPGRRRDDNGRRPVIASGGAGEVGHFTAAALAGADAVLAASVFHFGQLSIAEVKQGLAAAGLPVRAYAPGP